MLLVDKQFNLFDCFFKNMEHKLNLSTHLVCESMRAESGEETTFASCVLWIIKLTHKLVSSSIWNIDRRLRKDKVTPRILSLRVLTEENAYA